MGGRTPRAAASRPHLDPPNHPKHSRTPIPHFRSLYPSFLAPHPSFLRRQEPPAPTPTPSPIHPSPLSGGRLGGGWDAPSNHQRSRRASLVIPAQAGTHPPQHHAPSPIHPSPLSGGRLGGGWNAAHRRRPSTPQSPKPPQTFPHPNPSFPRPSRHSCAGRNLPRTAAARFAANGRRRGNGFGRPPVARIPACAGMTVGRRRLLGRW